MSTKVKALTEDEVRDMAKELLGFNKKEHSIKQGTGQITTFNQLGFTGYSDKPDGWYLPNDRNAPAIILETKSGKEDLLDDKWIDELTKNCNIALTQFKTVIGILFNGTDLRVFKNNIEVVPTAATLQDKSYYLALATQTVIDKQKIYGLTKKINNALHFDFGIKNLYHRMIFTACALVAKRCGALLVKNMDFNLMKNSILNTLSKSLENSRKQNLKLDILIEVYSEIKMNNTANQDAIDQFIANVTEISDCVNSDYWNGEDVMGIFFNEFNRYKKKSENGQVFTPDHITSFMYRLLDIDYGKLHEKFRKGISASTRLFKKIIIKLYSEKGGTAALFCFFAIPPALYIASSSFARHAARPLWRSGGEASGSFPRIGWIFSWKYSEKYLTGGAESAIMMISK